MKTAEKLTVEQIVEQLRQDYARFPKDQTYSLYAEDVKFKDPMNAFKGVELFRRMIGFIDWFFGDVQMDLHSIEASAPSLIELRWTLNMDPPVPWSSRLHIPGRTELQISEQGLIESHVDYWNCSRLDVLKQVFKTDN
ncbi:DUF2358 domain-containing protein [cf. Phormidesmis sp. LEGE 11477]|uniref:DUF2358 domain-containing protein n=1 Tax=cf. Phormidesmis sp. LEGE 11477 TaxID=1828680 RepID=UPI00187E4725|nr:DUF2358 domain-containing protein [cf. Phormidesmis sp. LEGE 11477]MBE9060808.1 DUF2358 domain-containing protein [cf. Phormidesmis sp. LEGE 11477]